MSEIAWALLGIAVAYWGDRIHRASWLGSLTLLQCAAFLALVVPHISYDKDVIVVKEDSSNITHMSIYSGIMSSKQCALSEFADVNK